MTIRDTYLNKLREEKVLVDLYTDSYGESYYGFIIDFTKDVK